MLGWKQITKVADNAKKFIDSYNNRQPQANFKILKARTWDKFQKQKLYFTSLSGANQLSLRE